MKISDVPIHVTAHVAGALNRRVIAVDCRAALPLIVKSDETRGSYAFRVTYATSYYFWFFGYIAKLPYCASWEVRSDVKIRWAENSACQTRPSNHGRGGVVRPPVIFG